MTSCHDSVRRGLALGLVAIGCSSSSGDAQSNAASQAGTPSVALGSGGAGGASSLATNGGGQPTATAPVTSGAPSGGQPTATAPVATGTLSDRYPDEASLVKDPAVLFFDNFEGGWGKWDSPSRDTENLFIETNSALARSGTRYLRSTVTETQLQANEYISSSTKVTFSRRVDLVYWRFYARFKGIAPPPHHWVRATAGTEAFSSSGLANTVPPGDQGFWFDFDANTDDVFDLYVYWYKMRSGRCNDGTATPGCAGDQGTTYHYGNVFRPPNQQPFGRDRWFCVEIMAKANTVGSSDGALAFAVDGQVIGDYRPGFPIGTWLRDSFHTNGCTFSACTAPVPFDGFEFRSSADVKFKGLFLDAYYERNTTASRRADLEAKGLTVLNEQTIYYDDVVVATEPIGCGKRN